MKNWSEYESIIPRGGNIEEEHKKAYQTAMSLICPITQELMLDPVNISSGHTYERSHIEIHFKSASADRDPYTNYRLVNRYIIPNFLVKTLTKQFVEFYEDKQGKEWESVVQYCNTYKTTLREQREREKREREKREREELELEKREREREELELEQREREREQRELEREREQRELEQRERELEQRELEREQQEQREREQREREQREREQREREQREREQREREQREREQREREQREREQRELESLRRARVVVQEAHDALRRPIFVNHMNNQLAEAEARRVARREERLRELAAVSRRVAEYEARLNAYRT